MEKATPKLKTITQEQRTALKAPLPDEAVSPHPTKSYLSSIKAIYVVERLNDVFGLGEWKVKNEVLSAKENENTKKVMVVVKSVLTINGYDVEVEQFGGNDNDDLGDAYKGAATDALTKIGSYLEIGIDVFKGKQTGKKKEANQRPPVPITGGIRRPVAPQELVKIGKCSVCGTTGVRASTGRYYCPNYKEHNAKGEKWSLEADKPKLNKNEQDFIDSLPK